MSEISFSIIVPVFNREACVHLTVDSVCRQDYPNWELILVDDGSADQTGSICRKYAAADSRIRYFRKENGGVSSARNLGLQNVSGEYILFLDSDDSMVENCLSILYQRISEQTARPDMLCFGTQSGSSQWKPTECMEPVTVEKDRIRNSYLPAHINIYPQNKHFLLNYIWNKCYRTDFVKAHGLLFDENRRTWEDGLFVVNCLDKAQDILLIPDILHNGCVDPSVDHLSGKFYESQIEQYIQDEMRFKVWFEGEYDFASEHYCHANLNTLNTLFSRAFSTCGKKSKIQMEKAAKSPIVLHWVTQVKPKSNYEQYLRACIISKKYHWVYYFYRFDSAKHMISRRLHR